MKRESKEEIVRTTKKLMQINKNILLKKAIILYSLFYEPVLLKYLTRIMSRAKKVVKINKLHGTLI